MERNELTEIRVSTEPFEKTAEIDAFLEVWGRNILNMEMNPLDGHPLQFDMLLRSLPGFATASGSMSPMRNRHIAELSDNDDLVLTVIRSGFGELNQYGRVATVSDGDAVLTANGAPASFTTPTPIRVVNYRFRRSALLPYVPNLDDLVARPISRNNRVLQLLVGYASALNDQGELTTAELRRAVTTHMHELAALLLREKAELRLGAEVTGLRAARLHAIKGDIGERLGSSELSINGLALRHGVSARYIQKLFEMQGTTFTEYVMERRLVEARRILSDPRLAGRTISDVAGDVGFGDLSYFTRSFRRRFGMTPSDARELARRENGPAV